MPKSCLYLLCIPPFCSIYPIPPLPSAKILLDFFESYQKPPETELSNALSFPVFTFIDDGFLLIMKMGSARQPVCLFANLQLTNTLLRVERDYKIRQYFTPFPWIFFFLKVNVPLAFWDKKEICWWYKSELSRLTNPFLLWIGLGPWLHQQKKTDKTFQISSNWLQDFRKNKNRLRPQRCKLMAF